ncbi:MAG: isoprenylcysteine carboxylmethyltransferase family protein [Candidatus Dormibacteria bacterium]
MSPAAGPPASSGRTPFLHMPVPWVYLLAYLVGVGLQFVVPVTLASTALSLAAQAAGLVLFVAGWWLAGWGLLIFRRAETTTTPGEAPKRLVTRGPYRFTRNPMYAGLTLAYLGEAGLLVQFWPLPLLVFTLVYVNCFVIPVEEASLREFGDAYSRYRSRARRWL